MAEEVKEQTTQPAQSTSQSGQTTDTQGSATTQSTDTQTAQQPAQTSSGPAATDYDCDDAAPRKNGRTYFIVAIVCTALGGLFFGLTSVLKVYALLAAILLCLTSLSFLGTQKKRENFKGVFVLTLITYILLGLLTAFFIGGVIWSSVT